MTVPLWLFVVVLIWALLASFRRSIVKLLPMPLPVPDLGFRIFVCKDDRALNIVSEICKTYGLIPRFRLNSEHVDRVMMDDGFTVLNSPDEDLRRRMGHPAAGLAIPVTNPRLCASDTALRLRQLGYHAQMEALTEVPDKPDAMFYVASDAFPGWALIFRLPMMKMGKPEIRPY